MKTYDCIREHLNALLHLCYPHICFGCGTDQVNKGLPLCPSCIEELPYTEFFGMLDNPIEKIFWGRAPVQQAGALLFFTKDSLVQHLIAQLKYQHNKKVGILFGTLMGKVLAAQANFHQVDLLLPIPIRSAKKNQRGYNQSLVIALGIQQVWNIPIDQKALQKSSWTGTQTKKNRHSRLASDAALFVLAHPSNIEGKNILLIDDVLTTGATLEAAVKCLMTGAPASVSIAVAAYTL